MTKLGSYFSVILLSLAPIACQLTAQAHAPLDADPGDPTGDDVGSDAVDAMAVETDAIAGDVDAMTEDVDASAGTVDGMVDAEPPGAFTIIVIPDTQKEMWSSADTRFANRMTWIAENQAALDIRFAIQVGDLVDTDNCRVEWVNDEAQCSAEDLASYVYYIMLGFADQPHYQYERASSGLAILDSAAIPYALAVGNHDTSAVCGGPACSVPGMTTNQLLRKTYTWNAFFGEGRFPALAGTYEAGKTDNVYHTFAAGGLEWLVLSLELWPRSGAIDWAETVLSSHPQHNAIIVTHSYLTGSGGVGGFDGYGDTTPETLRDRLILKYPNVRLVLSGHTGTTTRREDIGVNGNRVYSFLDCYHDASTNPTRIMRIDTSANLIDTWVYNPSTGVNRSDGDWTIPDVGWVH